MSDPVVKGWCPGALRPMMSGDGLVVRIRPRLARLYPQIGLALADLALQFGNGHLEVTNRANLQLRGVASHAYPALSDALQDLGLLDETPEAEQRRNVLVVPSWCDGDDISSIAAELEQALATNDALNLPAKFGFAVDCGPTRVLADASADIRIERCQDGGLICRADGAPTGQHTTLQNAASDAIELAEWFVRSGGISNGRGRMSDLLKSTKPPSFKETAAPVAASGKPTPGEARGGCFVGVPFGQIAAEDLRDLSRQTSLRLTPWRMVFLEKAPVFDQFSQRLVTDPEDPRMRVVACGGAPACPQALGTTRAVANQLAHLVPAGETLHVSGCQKGCAFPKKARVTLVAVNGSEYDLVLNGTPDDTPIRRVSSPDLMGQITGILR